MGDTDETKNDLFEIAVNNTLKTTFLEMARWTKFLSVLGLVCIGIILVASLLLAFVFSMIPAGSNPVTAMGTTGLILNFLVMLGVNFYPIYSLLMYSRKMKSAVQTSNELKFAEAIVFLKNFFKFIGVLLIVIFSLYAIMVVALVGNNAWDIWRLMKHP